MESPPGVSFTLCSCIIHLLQDQQPGPFIPELNVEDFFSAIPAHGHEQHVLEVLKDHVELKYRLRLLCEPVHGTMNWRTPRLWQHCKNRWSASLSNFVCYCCSPLFSGEFPLWERGTVIIPRWLGRKEMYLLLQFGTVDWELQVLEKACK